MKFEFKNLGRIEKGEIKLGKLTIIAGNNNTGKTYISYTIWGYLNRLKGWANFRSSHPYFKQLIDKGMFSINSNDFSKLVVEFLDHYDKTFSSDLSSLFKTQEEYFKDYKVTCNDIYEHNKIEYSNSKTLNFGPNSFLKFGWEFKSDKFQIFIEEFKDVNMNESIANFVLSKALSDIIYNNFFIYPYIITSERTGIALFYKELDFSRNNIIELLKKEKPLNPINLLETLTASYAEPINNNINATRFFFETQKGKKSIIAKNHPEEFKKINKMLSTILDGNFKYSSDQIFLKTKTVKGKSETLPLYITSSAAKSLFLIDLFIRSVADRNQILMIDEPELNLHPSNQILMARILANLVNLGIDVLITTHSDYMIKEFNNLIMLSNEFKDKERIMKTNGYDELDTLEPDKVRAYFVEKHTIKEAKTDKFGMDYKLFDDTIIKIN